MQASTSTLRGTLQPGAARATRALLGAAPAQGGCAECFARRARARTTSTQATRTLTTGEETNSRDTLPPRRKPFIARLSSDVYAASFPEDIPRWRRRSQSAILQDDSEKRRFVELRGLADTVTPGDVRRLVSSRMDPNYDGGGREDLRNVVMLPTMSLQPTGRWLVEFSDSLIAARFLDRIRGSSGPGSPDAVLHARLVDPDRSPVADALQNRRYLSAYATTGSQRLSTSANLTALNAHSGSTVRLQGFPRNISELHIMEHLRADGFELVRLPDPFSEDGRLDDLVKLPSPTGQNTRTSWSIFLARLPNIAEALRLARTWNATWPEWGLMRGQWKIRADVVW